MSDNHDQQRAIVEFSARGALAASVLYLTLDGVPFLYNGQEISETTATNHQSDYPMRRDLDKPEEPSTPTLVRQQKITIEWYRQLLGLRKRQAALNTGELVWIGNSLPASVVSFERRPDGKRIAVLVSTANRKVAGSVRLSAPVQEILLRGREDGVNGAGEFQLSAFGYVVLR
jgi:glycosidase